MKTSITEPSFDIFKEKCSRSQDFDLLCSIHLSENDHTRILRDILNQKVQGEKMFLESFIAKVLQLEKENISSCKCIDQQPAKGNQKNSKGYVDLLITSKTQNIIIENKVCGAGDTKDQLKRYCSTYCSKKQLEELHLDGYKTNDGQKTARIFYLTCDGQKEPSKKSTGDSGLVKQTWYHAINYERDILPWLENDVLPNIPYKSDGNMIKGILLYINYLYLLVGRSGSDNLNLWEGCTISILYKALKKAAPKKTEDETVEDNVLYRKYINSLKTAIDSRLNQIVGDINKEWSAHFAPSYIQLYKNSWLEHFDKRRNCPIHFELLNYKKSPHLAFHIESLEYENKKFRENINGELNNMISNLSLKDIKFEDEKIESYFRKILEHFSKSNLCAEIEQHLSNKTQI